MEDVSGLPQFGDESKGNENRDRLSELPHSLILFILSFLPILDVVRTSVLSKQWKDLWTTIPVLDFGAQKFDPHRICSNNCSNIVNRVLELWKGTKIIRFVVDVNCYCSAKYIKSWLDFAMDHGVEELSFLCTEPLLYYRAPLRLFSYSALRKLSLWFSEITITENVHWNRLKSLDITVSCLEDHVIDKILSGAPQLDVLKLVVFDKYDNLIIQSSSLKRLMIYLADYLDKDVNTSLTIWAPNLQTLQISGVPCRRYVVMNLSSVKELTFGFHHRNNILREPIEDMLRQFFPTILRAEKVTLRDHDCTEALAALEKKYLLSLASRIKIVKVRFCCSGIVGNTDADILRTLESIVIQHRSSVIQHRSSNPKKKQRVMRKELECDLEMSCSSGDEKLMSLLKHASYLEEMVIFANPE